MFLEVRPFGLRGGDAFNLARGGDQLFAGQLTNGARGALILQLQVELRMLRRRLTRWVVGAVGLACLIHGAANAQDQSRLYLQRFLEEAKRKVPEIVLPPPTAEQFKAKPGPQAQAIDMDEARRIIGLGTSGAGAVARIPGGKLGIIDLGFRGLKEWLDAHPEERKLTNFFHIDPSSKLKFVGDPDLTAAGEEDHGYWVYRVARAVLPDVPILLFRASSLSETGLALINGSSTHNVVLFNISLGFLSLFDIVASEEDIFAKNLRLYLPQYEAFAFISAGNSRTSVHSWISADLNRNGYVDFREGTVPRRDGDSARVVLRKGSNRILLTWDIRAHPDADYQLELVGTDGRMLATAIVGKDSKRKGIIGLSYTSNEDRQPAEVRIKRIAGPAHGVFMRLHAYPIGVRGDFNGLQTASTYELRENPFVIFVGSFGKAHGGGLAPSHFSDIATGADGKLIPHVLGPGQLRLDGKELNGTSFSSPFLTALYATRVGYNIKNLIERTSNHARLNAGVQRFEGSRWGTPDAAQISKDLKAITGPTKIDGISQRIEGDNLVIKFSISRCCMERLTWFVYARLYDPESHDPLRIPGTDKPVSGFATLYSEKPDYVRYPVEVRIPIKGLDSIKGKPVDVKFDLLVRSWRTSPLGRMPVDEPPLYRIAALGLTGPALAAKRPDDGATINDSDILREVRDRLYELNFDPGPLNGPFGEPVRQAIRNFETSHKMAQTGVPTQALLQKLRDLGEQKPWGTIAYDKSKNKWGMSWNHTSRKEAVLNARTRCGDSKQCAAEISFFGNECGAFAYSERGWSLASRTDIQRARDAALSDCRKRGKSCAIVAAVCSDGSHKFPASH